MLRVGVFMSARSIEGEVSFNSGRTICDHLDTARFEAIPIFQDSNARLYILPLRFLHRGKISDFAHRLKNEAQVVAWDDLPNLVDFIYIAAHGRYVEDGQLQGMLAMLGVPYLGSKVYASALGMDKAMQKDILAAHGINTPHGIVVNSTIASKATQHIETIAALLASNQLDFPLVVKPQCEGSSLGTTIAHDIDSLISAIVIASTVTPGISQGVLVEQKLQGMEFTCIVLTDIKTKKPFALPPTEVVPEDGSVVYDYEQKYMPGRAHKFTPARCSTEITQAIQQTCIKVMEVMGMATLARIDGFVQADGTIVIIDPNTFSGMGPAQFIFRQAAEINMSHTELINHLIASELAGTELEEQSTLATEEQPRLRVAVIMGGASNEREISLESGRNMCYKLSPEKYTAIPLFLNRSLKLYHLDQKLLVCHSTAEIELGLVDKEPVLWSQLAQVCDFAFLALHGGEGENGTIQGTLETLSIPYNGSGVLTSALCMDKYKTTTLLRHKGFDVPNSVFVRKELWIEQQELIVAQIEQQLGWPVIVKPHDDGCSVMVAKARNVEQLTQAIDEILQHGKPGALVEECITGMELTVGVIGNGPYQALPPSYAVSTQDVLSIEEKFLPGAGENQTPAPIPADAIKFVQEAIEQVFSAVAGSGYARIDCFYQNEQQSPTGNKRLIIIEINTLPGMTPATCIFHQAAEVGIKPMDFVDMIVQLGLEKHASVYSGTVPSERISI